ncbi:MAG TPA: hypothetical protein VLA66_11165 [Thermoanaerobaculia bacterium]|nr:hypothetical protein [Thermoanaerobaculia bacterium]
MSLVSDALKKAQREAAAREAREKGLPEQLVTSSQPYRARRSGGGTLALAVTAALAAGAAIAWFLLARPAAGPGSAATHVPPPPATTADDPAPTATAEAPIEENGEAPPAGSAQGPAPASAASAPPEAAAPASPDAAAGSPPSLENEERVAAPAPSGAAPAPSPAAPKAQPAEREFVREAQLDDGVVVRLGGIAWSDVAPLAYLNGRLLGVGESVSGWTIERIERDGVRLSGTGGTIRIALR